ncbi:hypothetical protein O3G_MSEX005603 [Manduca sexta]|uniref:C2H2-type domain-containing protein n=1 Tax=Manduca sexta TaxID=7130 RepID=A0A922CJL8_MANSE|nr:hypothetical protein O3G_MSEX005603 [Manduca sexta]
MILHGINLAKVMKFSNINEIRNKLGYKEVACSKPTLPIELMDIIEIGKICTIYNNTTITKMRCKNKEMPILDFLQSIKTEEKNEDFAYNVDTEDYGFNSDRDDEYIPENTMKKKYKQKKKIIKATKSDIVHNVCIRPIYLEDVRVLYYEPLDEKEKKEKTKLYAKRYAKKQRKDICCYCGKVTKSLKSHQLQHIGERKYKCDICSKTYLMEGQLKYHRKLHTTERKYKCDICVETCLNANALQRHMKRHSNVMSYFCNVCNKGFKRKTTLTRHLRQHNSENRNVKCELCSMTFYTKGAMQHHMRVHTGERPYKCEICSQPYSYKRDFNRHCFKKHGVFLKRRSVNVMNEEVLLRERTLMKELFLRKQGFIKEDQPLNPFEGPQSAMAFEHYMQALDNRQIQEDF